MALGNSNISITLVQDTIEVHSTSSLLGLIAKAMSGGVGGYAFYIYETRGSNENRYDGYLISGAEPHWNRWSNKMPAEWDYSNGTMECRLKRNVLNPNGGYDGRLHDFRGYDHSAVQPQLFVDSSFNFTSGVGDIEFLVNFHQIALPADITHILAKATIGAQVLTTLIPLADIIDSTPLISAYSIHFTNVSETSGTLQLYASNSIGQEVATLGNIVTTKSFVVNHVAQYAYLSRLVGAPFDPDVMVNGNIIVPSGTGNIQIAAGTTELTGITIRFTGQSTVYSTVFFELYLHQTGESDKYVGDYYVSAGDPAVTTDLTDIAVTLNSAAAAGDSLGFVMANVIYS